MTNGVLLLDKPAGITSFQALGAVKQRLGTARVGHTGTLDRFASGLLVAVAGRLTRLAPVVERLDKEYLAVVVFGESTDTLDPEGEVTARGAVPAREALEAALPTFRGLITQVPPAYSAVHVAGCRAHQVARSGGAPALAPRPVTVHRLELLQWSPPQATFSITCSRGTYVRALARDIAAALGTCAHVAALRRTRVGGLRVEDAHPPAEIDPRRDLIPARSLFERCPALGVLVVQPAVLATLEHGGTPADTWFAPLPAGDGTFGAFSADGGLVALVERREGRWRCSAVFPSGSHG